MFFLINVIKVIVYVGLKGCNPYALNIPKLAKLKAYTEPLSVGTPLYGVNVSVHGDVPDHPQ